MIFQFLHTFVVLFFIMMPFMFGVVQHNVIRSNNLALCSTFKRKTQWHLCFPPYSWVRSPNWSSQKGKAWLTLSGRCSPSTGGRCIDQAVLRFYRALHSSSAPWRWLSACLTPTKGLWAANQDAQHPRMNTTSSYWVSQAKIPKTSEAIKKNNKNKNKMKT